MRVFGVTAAVLTALALAGGTRADDGVLDHPVALVRWSGVPLRHVLARANEGLDRGLVLDRRLDPSRHVELELRNTTNRGVFEALAKDAGGELRVVGETSYLGPAGSAPLRTLIYLRQEEARESRPSKAGPEQRTFSWDDFSTPRDVLTRLSDEYGTRIEGTDAIPHDLWAGAVLPDATFAEAVSIVLIQFDRTFEWNEEGTGIRIVPIPEIVGYERFHRTRGRSAAEFAAALQKRFPEARVEVAGRRVRVFGSLESHEAAAADPNGEEAAADQPEPSPLDRQRFTLRVESVPASAVIKRLEQAGLKFEYDAKALATANVDLDQRIDLDVKDATTSELLRAVLDPLKVDFALDGTTVRMQPRE